MESGLYALFAAGEQTAGPPLSRAVWCAESVLLCLPAIMPQGRSRVAAAPSATSPPVTHAEDEAWLCQETGWAWLRRIGASSTAGQSRLRLRRGYEEPASKVGRRYLFAHISYLLGSWIAKHLRLGWPGGRPLAKH